MSSEIKVTNIKHSSSGSNNLVLASDGTTTVNGALTASGGIANAGTISAGTIGSAVAFPSDTVLQYVAKQLRSGSNYFTGTIQATSSSADPDATGVKVTFPRAFTTGSHIVWHYYCSDSNNNSMNFYNDSRVKPYYKDTSNNWASIDSIVWPNEKNLFLQTAYASSSIGTDKQVGFGILQHSGSGTVTMANIYAFAMIVAYEVKFTTSPL